MQGERLPDDWKPSEYDVQYGINLGFTATEVEGFAEDLRLWAAANANRQIARKSNWGMAFKGWMRRAMDQRKLREKPKPQQQFGGRPILPPEPPVDRTNRLNYEQLRAKYGDWGKLPIMQQQRKWTAPNDDELRAIYGKPTECTEH